MITRASAILDGLSRLSPAFQPWVLSNCTCQVGIAMDAVIMPSTAPTYWDGQPLPTTVPVKYREFMNIENRYSAARDKYFAENPSALRQIESVSASVIEAAGMTVAEYRDQQRCVVFAEAAKVRGIEVDEFVIRLMADSPEQANTWRLDRHREIADTLGIAWDEYKSLNRITE